MSECESVKLHIEVLAGMVSASVMSTTCVSASITRCREVLENTVGDTRFCCCVGPQLYILWPVRSLLAELHKKNKNILEKWAQVPAKGCDSMSAILSPTSWMGHCEGTCKKQFGKN